MSCRAKYGLLLHIVFGMYCAVVFAVRTITAYPTVNNMVHEVRMSKKTHRTSSTPEVATPEVATPEVATPEVATPEVATPEVATLVSAIDLCWSGLLTFIGYATNGWSTLHFPGVRGKFHLPAVMADFLQKTGKTIILSYKADNPRNGERMVTYRSTDCPGVPWFFSGMVSEPATLQAGHSFMLRAVEEGYACNLIPATPKVKAATTTAAVVAAAVTAASDDKMHTASAPETANAVHEHSPEVSDLLRTLKAQRRADVA